MILEITSSSNKQIKHVKSLQRKKYRDKYNEYIVEGLRIVEHGLCNGVEFSSIFCTDEAYDTLDQRKEIKKILDKGIYIYKVNDKLFKEISTTENSQGIIGIIKKKFYKLDSFIDKDKIFIIILDRLQDPGNLGTIIRTADAAGVDLILTTKGCVDIYNDKTIRSTMGSIFTMPVIHINDDNELIKTLKDKKINIISTTLEAKKYHHDIEYGEKNAIIIGNEGNGICKELIDESNIKIKIPIIGNAESLNASVASGIVIYELVRQSINSEN